MQQTSAEDGWWCFLKLCTELKTAQEFNDLFDLFLTIQEKQDVGDRYLIVRDLLKGDRTQREMAGELQVSIAKITRGSNSLKMIGERLRNFLIDKIN